MESIDEKAKLINEADLSAHKNIADKNARRLQVAARTMHRRLPSSRIQTGTESGFISHQSFGYSFI